MGRTKITKAKDRPRAAAKGSNSPDCPCKLYLDANAVECEKCLKWWHAECANLIGLSHPALQTLERWLCPNCYVSPLMTPRDLSPDNCGSMVKMMTDKMAEQVPLVAAAIHGHLKGTVENVVEHMMKTVVEDTIEKTVKNAEGRVAEVIEKVEKSDEKKWSHFFKGTEDVAEERKKELKEVVKEVVTENQTTLVNDAVTKSKAVHDDNYLEREKRNRNIVIKNVEESKKTRLSDKIADDRKAVMEILEKLDVTNGEVTRVTRPGPSINGKCRPLIVTVLTPQLANDLHGYTHGKRVFIKNGENDDRGRVYWINPDQILADREANYRARAKKRELDDEWREKAKKDVDRAINRLRAKRISAENDVVTENVDEEVMPELESPSNSSDAIKNTDNEEKGDTEEKGDNEEKEEENFR